MVCSTSVFDDVGVTAGRGVGGRVTCSRPLPWRYPTGFAGISHAIVLGLGVRWSVRGLLVDALWPWLVSMVQATSVFDDVGGVAGRRLGRLGRLGCLGCLLVDDFCGGGVGFSSVRGCGLRWWPLTWSSRVTVRRGLRVGEAAPRWCEAAFEAVGRWRDTERCVIVTQHVVGWGGKHPNTRENTKEHMRI